MVIFNQSLSYKNFSQLFRAEFLIVKSMLHLRESFKLRHF